MSIKKKIEYLLSNLLNSNIFVISNATKCSLLFKEELINYYKLYSIIYKEFDFIQKEISLHKNYLYLKNNNDYVCKYIQNKYGIYSELYSLDPEILDLKNKVIQLVCVVMKKLYLS